MTLKDEVLQVLRRDRDTFTAWQTDPPEAGLSPAAWATVIAHVVQVLDDTIEDIEDLDDGPPLQDETELAHNELDLHDVPRTPDGQSNALPLWFRIKKLVERDGPPSLQKTLESTGEPPHIHVPTGKRFPVEMVAGILDSVFNNDQRPLANYAAKLMTNSKACETCEHFYDASLDDCPNPDCPAEYVKDELESLADADTDTLLAAAYAEKYCQVCRANGRLSSLEAADDGSLVCLRCDWRSGEPVE